MMRGFGKSSLMLAALAIAALPVDAQSQSKGFVIVPTVLRVGAFGPPCTHATLQDALLDAVGLGENIIRLADNQLYTDINVDISGRNVTIEGGYPDCAAAQSSGERTTLNGEPNVGDSVIEFVGGSTLRTLTLRHLEIRGGSEDNDGGGGLQVDGEADVVLENVRFEDNQSTTGGAIRLIGTPADPVELSVPVGGSEGAVVVIDNQSSGNGGGISCNGAAIRVAGILVVVSNAVFPSFAGDGGGIDLFNCDFVVGSFGADAAELSVNNNSARYAGGINIATGSNVLLRGARHDLIGNTAIEGAGAMQIYSSGSASTARFSNMLFSANQVIAAGGITPRGGAILVRTGGTLEIAQNFEPCRTLDIGPRLACNTIRNNRIDAEASANPTHGGAIAMFGANANLLLAQTYLGTNEIIPGAGPARGAALHADDNSSGGTLTIDLESVIFDRNTGADEQVWLDDGSDAVIAYTSFNFASGVDAAVRTRTGAALELHANVSLADVLIDASGGGSVAGDCNFLGSGDDSFASIATFGSTDVLDADNGDLRPTSTAIQRDRCSTALYMPQHRDALNRIRPLGLLEVPNAPGPYDAGAYEAYPEGVFADGFEET